MSNLNEDPVVRSARREAIVALVAWLAAMTYTVGYCWRYAYGPAEELRLIFGVPEWVLWGVVAPWVVCIAICWWFAYGLMTDEPLGAEAAPPDDDPSLGGADHDR